MSSKQKAAEPQESINTTLREAPPQFPISRLREDCLALFGVPTSTFDGAMYGVTREMSVEEAAKRIDSWKNSKIGGK